jgi:hypothetical protein
VSAPGSCQAPGSRPARLYRPEIVEASFSACDLLDLTEILEDRVRGGGAYTGSSLA